MAGTLLNYNATDNISMASVIFRAPINPSLRDSKEDFISNSNKFILSHSCNATTTYGDLSFTLPVMSSILKSGGALAFKSINIPITPESFLPPLDIPPYTLKIVSKIVSQVVVKYPISALGCNPKRIGDSTGSLVSM